MAILRGGRRIGNYDIRIGIIEIGHLLMLQKTQIASFWWFRCHSKISGTDKSR